LQTDCSVPVNAGRLLCVSQYCGDDFGMLIRQSSLASRLTDSVATKFLIITRGVMDKDIYTLFTIPFIVSHASLVSVINNWGKSQNMFSILQKMSWSQANAYLLP